MVSEKKRIEEAEERKKQRELKKFGKKVQTAKMMERAKEKKCDAPSNALLCCRFASILNLSICAGLSSSSAVRAGELMLTFVGHTWIR